MSLWVVGVQEVKNGRLAMVAFLGFAAQYAATGKGPIDNLIEHITTGGAANFVTNGESRHLARWGTSGILGASQTGVGGWV